MTVAIAPTRIAPPDPTLQQLLMRLTGALNRRRAYAATHPMVVAAEQQLHESAVSVLVAKPVLTVGVMKTELLIDGEPYVTRSAYARELAMRLHRRGVGAITLQVGMPLAQLRDMLAWLATDAVSDGDFDADRPPVLSTISVTRVAYDQLTLGDVERAVQATGEQLWRSLAEIAGGLTPAGDAGGDGSPHTPHDKAAVLAILRDAVTDPDVARRTAIAFMDLAAQGISAPPEGRVRIGEQLFNALETLGASSFGPVIRSLGEKSVQQRFISQVVDVLPVAAVANWLQIAAQAQDQQMSHHMLRLMAKLSGFAEGRPSAGTESVFRGAAQDLVKGWVLDDPNPEEHVALLDRIALHERVKPGDPDAPVVPRTVIESSRLTQMALEINICGDDAKAAAAALVLAGEGPELLNWVEYAAESATATAKQLLQIATSDSAIRQLLLSEPVDRLQARALLERLDLTAAETLLDVLEAAEARGTRMIVRQRLADFGAGITPNLMARLESAPWFLVRNILTVLHDIAEGQGDDGAGMDSMARLLEHAQVQVRTEAFRVLLLNPRSRDMAIRRALNDDNERMVMLALQALTDAPDAPAKLPPHIVAELIAMVDSGKQNDIVRARVVRTLADTRSDTIRDWLMGLVVRRSRILRRMTLAEPTQTATAALQVLQRVYALEPNVQQLIALARKHGFDRRWVSRDTANSQEAGA
jgi:hypothetical protein